MTPMGDLTRRSLLATPAILSLAAAASACAQGNEAAPRTGSRSLVAYFTRSGNTRVIAGTLSRAQH